MRLSFGNIEVGFGVEPKGQTPKLMNQVHGNGLVTLNELPVTPEDADGVLTDTANFPLSVFTADCIPLLFFSRQEESKIAAVHCGWRGALAKIASKTVVQLKSTTTEVAIGPAILQCCFEVKDDLISQFESKGMKLGSYLEKRNGNIYFDLIGFTIHTQLRDAKIHTDMVRCTKCSEPRLPSYRRDKSTDPRIRSWIVKKFK